MKSRLLQAGYAGPNLSAGISVVALLLFAGAKRGAVMQAGRLSRSGTLTSLNKGSPDKFVKI